MVIAESTLSKTWITNRIKVTALFLLSGLLSGLASGWLSSSVARQLLALIVVVASPIFYTSRLGQIFSLGEIFLSQQSITLRSCLSQCASSQLVCVCSHSRFYKTSSFLLRL